MATDRTKEIDIVDMKEVVPVGEPRAGRMYVYPNNGAIRFRDDNLQTRSITPNTLLIVVGVGGDYTTLVAAVAGAPNGARIKLMEGTYVGDITFTKRLFIEGEGSRSIIDGNLIFNAGSDYSYVTNTNIRKNITFNTPAKYISTVFNWVSPTSTITDNNIVNSVASTYRLFASALQTFTYFAKANTTQQTFAEYTGTSSTHAFVPSAYSTYATGTHIADSIAYADTPTSTFATGTASAVVFTADFPGLIGNSISLVFDGVEDIATVVDFWNNNNTDNTVSHNGNPLGIVAAQTLNLSGATDDTYVRILAQTAGVDGNSISLVFNGTTDTTDSVIAAWNLANGSNQAEQAGPTGGVPPAGTITLTKGTDDSTFTYVASTLGSVGNNITIWFDGIKTAAAAELFWNETNEFNQVILTVGDPTFIIPTGNLFLTGGTTAQFKFIAVAAGVGGNSISFDADGTSTLGEIVTAWNGANSEKIKHDGVDHGVPSVQTFTLSGGSASIPIYFKASLPGVGGNSISLIFDGAKSVQQTMTEWNTPNTPNTVTTTVTTSLVLSTKVVTLVGGASGAAVVFTAVTPGAIGNTISLVFDGAKNTNTVVSAWNNNVANSQNQVSFTGNPLGVIAASTITLSGGQAPVPVTFTANSLGIVGNTIVLVYDGIKTLKQVVDAWNAIPANDLNRVHHNGVDSFVPYAITINLSGGLDATPVTFISLGGQGFTLVFDGIRTIKSVVDEWNQFNNLSQANYSGRPGSEPGIVPASTVRLAIGGASNMYILTQE